MFKGRGSKLSEEKGVALVFALLIMMVLVVLGSIFVLRTVNEWHNADRERRSIQAYYIAEAGAQEGLSMLGTLINTYMFTTINNTDPSAVLTETQQYADANDALGFLILAVRYNNVQQLTQSGNEAVYSVPDTDFGIGQYHYTIYITAKPSGAIQEFPPDRWDFSYFYQIVATGDVGQAAAHQIQLAGDFTISVQRDNFAKFALFTNYQTMPNGTQVWFTDKTNFDGPLHTNDRYNFALNPSGTFDGAVVQTQQTARFYNNGWPVLLDANANGTSDVPTFNAGFTRGASSVTMGTSTQEQNMAGEASAGGSFTSQGVYLPASGSSLTGGIYVDGNAGIQMSVDANNRAVYTITQGTTTTTVTVDQASNQTTVQTGPGTPQTYTGIPNGADHVGTLIYVNGAISSFSGTVQQNTELTVASKSDINITNNVMYSKYAGGGTFGTTGYVPPYVPTDPTDPNYGQNLLGLISWEGNVNIGPSAPNNIDVFGTVMAPKGIFQVTNYNDTQVGPRGTATVLGGVLTNYYGAFGLFNGQTGQAISGYGRNFVYDGRMQTAGKSPPYFPTLNTFIAFANDITDKVTQTEGAY